MTTRTRIVLATAAYFVTAGALLTTDLAGVGGLITFLPAGIVMAALVAVGHATYGAITRTWWTCGTPVLLPLVPLVLAPWIPADTDMRSYPEALMLAAIFIAPWLAGFIGLGVAIGRRRQLRSTSHDALAPAAHTESAAPRSSV